MPNTFTKPIILDTFSSAIDVGASMFNDTNAGFKLQSIEWQEPTTAGHLAVVTDGSGAITLFDETCVVANQSVIKYFDGIWVSGIRVGVNGVQSGKIKIFYH